MKLYTVVLYRHRDREEAWLLHGKCSWTVSGEELQDDGNLPSDYWWEERVWSCRATAEAVAKEWLIVNHVTEVMEFDVPWLESKT